MAHALAKALHALALGTEFNDRPQRYFSLDVGKRLPKNAVTIRKNGTRVCFFIQDPHLLDEAGGRGLQLEPVPMAGKAFNKDKFACSELDPAKVEANRSVIVKLLNESVRVVETRQPPSKSGVR